ncbi:RNA polymerase sigma factor [Aurantiacibacter sediminis]|uniref:RNA polymerase sigma factor n=1 Tax=Aurantiacibacter sediminis TaxID=2793064 RepID=A0ABS0N285_9SPHN|nr:RNA polymerase sigma factor [Aurantiacibacter sediminis]MBH5322057.1 RNA polymerase sigma factor [Aurantiacibacter sediminis]
MANTQRVYDELLVTLFIGGDRQAGERLAKRWHPRLLRAARRMLGDADLAQSAAQQSWVAIIGGIGSLSDPARFAPWTFAILRRKCADAIRGEQVRRQRAGAVEPDELPAAGSPGDDALAVNQAIATLPDDQRLAAHLFYVEGFTLAEIAEVQGVPQGTAKTRLFHARRKLKAALSGDVT